MSEQYLKDIHFFFTSVISLATSISLFQTIKYQLKTNEVKNKIKMISSKETKDISQIDNSYQSKEIVIKGNVEVGKEQPITVRSKSILGQYYINHIKYAEKMYSNESFQLEKGDYKINLKEILKCCQIKSNQSFYIASNNNRIKVSNYDLGDYQKALQIIKFQQKKKELTLFQSIQSLCLGLLRGLITIVIPDRNISFLKGIDTGNRFIQVGIKVGTPIVAFGTISVDSQGSLCIQPVSLFKDRFSYLVQLKQQLANLVDKKNGWLLLTIIGGIYIGRRIYKYVTKNGFKMPWKLKKSQ